MPKAKRKARKPVTRQLPEARVVADPDFLTGYALGQQLRRHHREGLAPPSMTFVDSGNRRTVMYHVGIMCGSVRPDAFADGDTYTVSVNGVPVELGNTASYWFLACLAEHQGEPVSKQALEKEVRKGNDEAVRSDLKEIKRMVVDRLRRLGHGDIADAIRAVRGDGYILNHIPPKSHR